MTKTSFQKPPSRETALLACSFCTGNGLVELWLASRKQRQDVLFSTLKPAAQTAKPSARPEPADVAGMQGPTRGMQCSMYCCLRISAHLPPGRLS